MCVCVLTGSIAACIYEICGQFNGVCVCVVGMSVCLFDCEILKMLSLLNVEISRTKSYRYSKINKCRQSKQ